MITMKAMKAKKRQTKQTSPFDVFKLHRTDLVFLLTFLYLLAVLDSNERAFRLDSRTQGPPTGEARVLRSL